MHEAAHTAYGNASKLPLRHRQELMHDMPVLLFHKRKGGKKK